MERKVRAARIQVCAVAAVLACAAAISAPVSRAGTDESPGAPAGEAAAWREPVETATSRQGDITPALEPDAVATVSATTGGVHRHLGTAGKSPSAMSIAELVAEITGGNSLVRTVAATQEALARGGVATADEGTVYVPAVAPASSAVAFPHETLTLAMEVRRRATLSSLTVAELGRTLSDFGWPFASDAAPGQQLIALLQLWVAGAQAAPSNPQSFNPLFIAEMAKRQVPPVDLAAGTARPEDAHLSLLELQLIAAAFDRLVTSALGAERWLPLAGVSANTVDGQLSSLSDLPSQPCSESKKRINEVFGPIGEYLWGEMTQRAGQEFMANALKAAGVSPDTVSDFKTSLSALSVAAKIWKLAALYANMQVSVTAEPTGPVHKPLIDNKKVTFVARAGVSAKDWNDYVNKYGQWGVDAKGAVRDCLGGFGLPTFADLSDIGGEAASWDVEWRKGKGFDQHAVVGPENTFEFPGQYQNSLRQVAPNSAETKFLVDIKPEDPKFHSDAPPRTTAVEVCAEVETAQPPTIGTFVTAAQGLLGVAESVVELSAGWLQHMAQPSDCATLQVTYHDEPVKGWHGFVLFTETLSNHSSGGCGPVHGTCSQDHEFSARTEVAVEGSGFRGLEGEFVDYPLRGSVSVTAEDIEVTLERVVEACTMTHFSYRVASAAATDRLEDALLTVFDGQYTLTFILPAASGFEEEQQSVKYSGPEHCQAPGSDNSGVIPWAYDPWFALPEIEGTIDPANPDHIKGNAAGGCGAGETCNASWDLTYTP